MIAAESSWERSRRGDICCLCCSLNLQIESKTRKASWGRRKVIEDTAWTGRKKSRRLIWRTSVSWGGSTDVDW